MSRPLSFNHRCVDSVIAQIDSRYENIEALRVTWRPTVQQADVQQWDGDAAACFIQFHMKQHRPDSNSLLLSVVVVVDVVCRITLSSRSWWDVCFQG